ncbi:PQQ-dependent sugar dehydrogenase [Planotetraspora sp. A-T 1434]|uniref:PQQ-dependent sugar dehydrogenase n=1 Tax=Planotetraspora sp. A-T 1434 TaxID=2979219 RepID=UPI0021BE516C|nr:PQQ-dependent sugar dehydrogenase [Planotetraspora sp. A-T 1434]MCT9931380.1 PQQ-dependent sugar dehydrogenase [Planotetraspora sp. A-T 1434]
MVEIGQIGRSGLALVTAVTLALVAVPACSATPESVTNDGNTPATVRGGGDPPATVRGGGDPPATVRGGGDTPAPLPSITAEPPGRPRTLVTDLAVPWAVAFLPGGDALVTERDSARLLRVTPQGRASDAGVIQGVAPGGEGGLLGVAVSPKFTTDHHVFVYFTADGDNRVVRYRYDGRLSDPVPLVRGIPKGRIHNGGRLAFGPDGFLYASTGETGREELAQDRDSLGGKILRMTVDGKPAPGNPFGTLVWTYGHRNVQGLAWDGRGHMYATEFGQNTYDEINLIEKGHNYGWPEVEGMGRDSRYTDPLLTWSTDEASPSGLAYADGSLWAAALRGRRLWQIPLSPDGAVGRPVARFTGQYGRLRAVATAPDGTLWVGTSNRDGRGSPRPGDDRILLVPPRPAA